MDPLAKIADLLSDTNELPPGAEYSIVDALGEGIDSTRHTVERKLTIPGYHIRDTFPEIFGEPASLEAFQSKLLALVLRLNRDLRKIAATGGVSVVQNLSDIYGPPFRCLDDRCVKFSNGYSSHPEFILHAASHEKFFKCERQACPYHQIGFATRDELKRHARSSHLELESKPFLASSTKLEAGAPWQGLQPPNQDVRLMVRIAKDALIGRDVGTAIEILENLKGLDFLDIQSHFEVGIGGVFVKILSGSLEVFNPVSLMEHIIAYGNDIVMRTLEKMDNEWYWKVRLSQDGYSRDAYFALAILSQNTEVLMYLINRAPQVYGYEMKLDKNFIFSWIGYPAPKKRKPWEYLLKFPSRKPDATVRFPLLLWACWVNNPQIYDILASRGALPPNHYDDLQDAQNDMDQSTEILRLTLTAVAGRKDLVDKVLVNGRTLHPGHLAGILAAMVAFSNLQEKIYEVCIFLKDEGAAFWKVLLADVFFRAFQYLLLYNRTLPTQQVVDGLRKCLDLGVQPGYLWKIWDQMNQQLHKISSNYREFHTTREAEIIAIDKLVQPLMELGIQQSGLDLDDLLLPGRYSKPQYDQLVNETIQTRLNSWGKYREGLFLWMLQETPDEHSGLIRGDTRFLDYFKNSWDDIQNVQGFLASYSSFENTKMGYGI
ncbi:hypothetical protein ABW19_dt0203130 [Dactylella cylindrospora]|nr:hypothetical protein ABW19_dt0203130 [Dactylella cylindrospora]